MWVTAAHSHFCCFLPLPDKNFKPRLWGLRATTQLDWLLERNQHTKAMLVPTTAWYQPPPHPDASNPRDWVHWKRKYTIAPTGKLFIYVLNYCSSLSRQLAALFCQQTLRLWPVPHPATAEERKAAAHCHFHCFSNYLGQLSVNYWCIQSDCGWFKQSRERSSSFTSKTQHIYTDTGLVAWILWPALKGGYMLLSARKAACAAVMVVIEFGTNHTPLWWYLSLILI